MHIASQKIDIKNWIDTITDESIIEEILAIKKQEKFYFEKEWASSISVDELHKRTKQHLK